MNDILIMKLVTSSLMSMFVRPALSVVNPAQQPTTIGTDFCIHSIFKEAIQIAAQPGLGVLPLINA